MENGAHLATAVSRSKERLKTKESLMNYGKEILDEAFEYFEFREKILDMKWSQVGPRGRDGMIKLFHDITDRTLAGLELDGARIKEGYSEEEVFYILSGISKLMSWDTLSKRYEGRIDQNGIKQLVDIFGVEANALQGKLKMAVHVRRNLEALSKINKKDIIFIPSASHEEIVGTRRVERSETGEMINVVDIGEPAARNINKVSKAEMQQNYLGAKQLGEEEVRAPMEHFGRTIKSGELISDAHGTPLEYRFYLQIIKNEGDAQNALAIYKYDRDQKLRLDQVLF